MKKICLFLSIWLGLTSLQAQTKATYSFETENLIGSGPDAGKVVIPILGDGYTEARQDSFLVHAKKIADFMVGFYPFNSFNAQNKLIIKAIKVVSDVSGASPNSFFHSTKVNWYLDPTAAGWQKFTDLMAQYTPNYAAAILLQNYANTDVGPFAWSGRKVLVQTSFHGNSATIHELGHALGQLSEEYDYQNYNSNVKENANLTQNTNPETVRWKNFIGVGDVGIYKHIFVEEDAADWYRPANNCHMRHGSEFCPVCAAAMVEKMAEASGLPFFGTLFNDIGPNKPLNTATTIDFPTGYGVILDYSFHGCSQLKTLTIPADVTSVGNYAFLKCTALTDITNHAETPQTIDADKVFFGVTRSNITLHVPAGKTLAYEAAGWTDFKIVEEGTPFTGYYVAFDPNGGSGNMSRMIFFQDSVRKLKTNTFTRLGWFFEGWATSSGGAVVYQDQQDVSNLTDVVEEVVTLYAVWTKGVLVTFNLNYSPSGTPPATQTITIGEKAVRPSDPKRETYNFGGWYTETACKNIWNFDSPVTTDLTLYAKWTGTSTTKTDISDASLLLNKQQWDYSFGASARPGVIMVSPYTISLSDYELSYEYDFPNGKGTVIVTPLPESNFTGRATAPFKIINIPEYITVTFNTQGGSDVDAQNVKPGEKTTQPADPARTGFTFDGWYEEEACTNAWNFATNVVNFSTTLYAKWVISSYSITFNSKGGSDVDMQYVDFGGKITQPADPTRTDFVFDGWYGEADYIHMWDFATDTVTGDTTLYAKWSPDPSATAEMFDTDMKIYPNPFSDAINITHAAGYTLQILTPNGVVVHTCKINADIQTVTSLQALPVGIYFLRLEKDGRMKTIKIVKQAN